AEVEALHAQGDRNTPGRNNLGAKVEAARERLGERAVAGEADDVAPAIEAREEAAMAAEACRLGRGDFHGEGAGLRARRSSVLRTHIERERGGRIEARQVRQEAAVDDEGRRDRGRAAEQVDELVAADQHFAEQLPSAVRKAGI